MYNSVTPKRYSLGVLENKKIYMPCWIYHELDPNNFEWDILKKTKNEITNQVIYKCILG